jgi:hypothetical protein
MHGITPKNGEWASFKTGESTFDLGVCRQQVDSILGSAPDMMVLVGARTTSSAPLPP